MPSIARTMGLAILEDVNARWTDLASPSSSSTSRRVTVRVRSRRAMSITGGPEHIVALAR